MMLIQTPKDTDKNNALQELFLEKTNDIDNRIS
jgi:hypothetical protein